MYGERGQDVIEALYANPQGVIPVVLKRLRQRNQEWTQHKRDWVKMKEDVNKNYFR